jgi:hypothetical protein
MIIFIALNIMTGLQKSGGLATLSNKTSIGQGYKSTEKYLVIGKSGSGKTQLAFDLIYFIIQPFSSIVYINSHFDDKILLNFSKWCEEAGIPVYNIPSDDLSVIPDITNGVFLIDDCYTSTGRDKNIELLVKELWNKGRWKGNHVIYIAHTDKRLPTETLYNSSGVFVDKYYPKFPCSSIIPSNKNTRAWYKLDDPLSDDGKVQEIQFASPGSKQEIIKKLRSKIPPKDIGKKVADKEDYKAIGQQGNKLATKMLKANTSRQSGPSSTQNDQPILVGGMSQSNLPFFGEIENYVNKNNTYFSLDNI